jgi:hypothetical protein
MCVCVCVCVCVVCVCVCLCVCVCYVCHLIRYACHLIRSYLLALRVQYKISNTHMRFQHKKKNTDTLQHAPLFFSTRRSAAGRALVPLRNAQPGGTRHAAAILAGPKRTTPALGTKKKVAYVAYAVACGRDISRT